MLRGARYVLGVAIGAIILALNILFANFMSFRIGSRHVPVYPDTNWVADWLFGAATIIMGGAFAFVSARSIAEKPSLETLWAPVLYTAVFSSLIATWYFGASTIFDLLHINIW